MGHYVGTIDGRAGMTQILGQSTAVANQRPDINKLDNIAFLLVFLMLLMFISLLVFVIYLLLTVFGTVFLLLLILLFVYNFDFGQAVMITDDVSCIIFPDTAPHIYDKPGASIDIDAGTAVIDVQNTSVGSL